MSELKTMYKAQVNSVETVLTQAITEADTTILVKDVTVFPEAPNLACIGVGADTETIRYNGVNTENNALLECERGFQGTAQSHVVQSVVSRNYTAYDHDSFVENIEQCVTKSTEQTIDGIKTFTSKTSFTQGLEAGNGINGGITFEDGKHHITNNDGGGNFNIRVGNKYNEVTEDGYCGHIVFGQDTGAWSLKTTETAQTTGEVPVWKNGLIVRPADVLFNGSTVWHSSNGGSGSGLDADKLDGKEATDFAPSGYGLGTIARYVSNTDWDEHTDTGFYVGTGMSNRPPYTSAHVWDYCTITKHNAGYALQEITDFNNTEKWQRVCINSVWQPWKRVLISKESTTWYEPTYSNDYEAWASSTITLKYGMIANGIVKISGLFNKTTTSFTASEVIATLPVGFRPSQIIHIPIVQTNNGASGVVAIAPTGNISITGHGGFDYAVNNALCIDTVFTTY